MRMRTFYAASSRDGMASVIRLHDALTRRGWRNAFPWPRHFDHVCSIMHCGVMDRAALAREELRAARSCDLFVGIARLGKGSHVELGAALSGPLKRIVLVGVDPADSVFYVASDVEVVASLSDLEKLLQLDDGEVA